MTWVCVGSSSPFATVALFEDDKLLASACEEAPMRASEAILKLLQSLLSETGKRLGEIEVFGADIGPGSFTGVKVAVTLAKSMAFALDRRVAGFSAFDLIARGGAAAVPSRRGWYLLRESAGEPVELRLDDVRLAHALGYGAAFAQETLPLAEHAAFASLHALSPAELVPQYVLEPSISLPKTPFSGGDI
jgi:hypothetical protein